MVTSSNGLDSETDQAQDEPRYRQEVAKGKPKFIRMVKNDTFAQGKHEKQKEYWCTGMGATQFRHLMAFRKRRGYLSLFLSLLSPVLGFFSPNW